MTDVAEGRDPSLLAQHLAWDASVQEHLPARLVLRLVAPLGTWFLLAALAPFHLATVAGLHITIAHIACLGLLAWYLRLDTSLGIACVLLFTVLLVAALDAALGSATHQTALIGIVWSASLYAVAWQVWMRSSTAPNGPMQAFLITPLVLAARFAFLLGLRTALRENAGLHSAPRTR